jgi:glucose/arabinose dehydrogenase
MKQTSRHTVFSQAVKWVLASLIFVGMVLGGWVTAWFFSQQLRGAAPAVLPPAQDVVKLVDAHEAPLMVPEGFSLGIYAKDLGSPRVLAADPNGVPMVSVTGKGEVLALPDVNHDGKAEPVTVVSGLAQPHGLAFRCHASGCDLYVAETDAVRRYTYDPATYQATNAKLIATLPGGGRHFTRSLLFLPPPEDDQLLIAVGSSCNVCRETDERRAKVLVVPADGGEVKEYAHGLRNTVFQAINPVTQEVWMTEMGRDLLGDDTPPDELNILKKGANYGFPTCYGQNIHDTDFDKNTYFRNPCQAPFETASAFDLPAHSAPLGLTFIQGEGWPKAWQGNLLVAYHGSWNRSVPTGYKVARFSVSASGTVAYADEFLGGFLSSNAQALGRPVGLLLKSDGELFVSDDKAGVVYRVFRTSSR